MRLSGVRNAALGAALAACGCSLRGDLLDPGTCLEPAVSRSTVSGNPTNVLSAFLNAEVRRADSAAVRFGTNAVLDSTTPAFAVNGDSIVVPVLGLKPSTTYGAQLVVFSRCGAATGEFLSFATGALPADIPVYSAEGSSPSPGFVVFAAGNYGLVIDNSGRVVWYHRFLNGPGLNFQPQPNGRYAARPQAAAGEIASWSEIAVDGSATRTLGCAHGYPPRMHDLIAKPDGSYWLLCDETRTLDLSGQGASRQTRVLGTSVQWRSATGDVLFEWSPFDHFEIDLSILQLADRASVPINWTHGNALDLDSDGNLLVSFRNLSEVTKIDMRTGGVVWRMGGAKNQVTFENVNMPAFVGQHGLRTNGRGQLILLDNLGDSRGSRAEGYDVDDARQTARLTSSYDAPPGVVAQVGGNTQALSGGHVLVSFGSGGGVDEYDASGTVVWRLVGNPGYIFRAERIRSLYHPGAGDPR